MNEPKHKGAKIGFTHRGLRTLASSLVLGIFGILFWDIVLVALASCLGIVPLFVYLRTRSKVKRLSSLVVFEPDGFEASLTAGETFQGFLEVKSSLGLDLRFIKPWEDVVFEPSKLGFNNSSVMFVFHPMLSGEYVSDELKLSVWDRLGLVAGERSTPFHLQFRVYPRVMAVAVEAANFLLGAGGLGLGDQPMPLRGSGLDYAESRVYVPGDVLRRMDWKATARLGSFVVKDYYVEGGVGTHVVYEAFAPDPVSLDELSASFLRAVLTFARMELPVGLTILDRTEVLYHGEELPNELAVALALGYVLKSVESEFKELYEVLEPRATKDLWILLREIDEFFHMESDALMDEFQHPNRFLDEFVTKKEGKFAILLVSSLMEDPVPVIELAEHIRNREWELNVLQPTRPWMWSLSLEDSQHIWKHYSKLNRMFTMMGVKLSTDIEGIYKDISLFGSSIRSHKLVSK